MSGFKTAQPTSPAGSELFSPGEVERLMRIEFERAARYGYPVVCMKIAVDRLDALQDLYGVESKDEILRSLIGLLRSATRDSDFLCALVDDCLLTLFPHTPASGAPVLARRLLEGARKMGFDSDGRSIRITLSIGLAHNQQPGGVSFDTLLQVAEEGLAVADAAGGDRFVETELYQLIEARRKREAEAGGPRRPQHIVAASPPAPIPAAPQRPRGDPRLMSLSDKLAALIASEGQDIGALTVEEKERILKALAGMAPQRAAATSEEEYKRQVELLERRLAKLSQQLGITEEELARVARMKNVDLGVASVYRSVQGLADDEEQLEIKRQLMAQIFEANVQLKMKLSSPG